MQLSTILGVELFSLQCCCLFLLSVLLISLDYYVKRKCVCAFIFVIEIVMLYLWLLMLFCCELLITCNCVSVSLFGGVNLILSIPFLYFFSHLDFIMDMFNG